MTSNYHLQNGAQAYDISSQTIGQFNLPPPELLFDGLRYEIDPTFIQPDMLVQEGYDFAIVVPTRSEEEDEDITESGPGFLVYNGLVYIIASDRDPAMVDDKVLRVSDSNKVQSAGVAIPMALDLSLGQTLPQPRSTTINDFGSNGPMMVRNNGVIKPRYPYTREHHDYLFELVESALTQLKRDLKPKDFHPITEKLHQKFRGSRIEKGTPLAKGGLASISFDYIERTSHNVHSYVFKTKRALYDQLKARILSS
ncbi:hypothetical protein BDZ45DRAFT_728750 [Acephala macrosclerotiorum]|nr:hypothetical protein BDZ45DRAFT_728750 [Acephala macrosclerotiorum]